MMKSEHPIEVLVAGAGPIGLYSALALAKQGIRVRIIDQAERRGGHSYALALHGKTLEILDQVGCLEPVLDRCYRVERIGLYDRGRRRAELRLPKSDHGFSGLAVIPQNQLEGILEEALRRQGLSVEWYHRLAHVASSHDCATVRVNQLVMDVLGYAWAHTEWHVGHSEHFDLPFVLGADGHLSLVRRQLPDTFEPAGNTQHFAVFEFKSDADLNHEMCLALDGNTANVLWPLPGGYCRWSFELPKYLTDDDGREKEHSEYEIIGPGQFPLLTEAYLEALIAQRAPWFNGSLEDIRWRIVVRFEKRLVHCFGKQRIWLAGDAAHLTGPVGMQSMNIGLGEAGELTRLMGEILRGGASLDRLDGYNRARLAEWRLLLGQEGGLWANAETDPWIARNADRLLSCLPASGEDLARLLKQLRLEIHR